jgi:hypothetical protein
MQRNPVPTPIVPLGRVVMTPGVAPDLEANRRSYVWHLLARHAIADWGCISDEDHRSNDAALRQGLCLLSAYPLDPAKPCQRRGENCLWILTEADRPALYPRRINSRVPRSPRLHGATRVGAGSPISVERSFSWQSNLPVAAATAKSAHCISSVRAAACPAANYRFR